jgi:hypothetical protein
MQGQAAIKEGLFESWTGNKTTSWNGVATEARLMIRHKKTIGEGDARFRYIENLFIETVDSERYKLPFTSLTAGRAMLEHVRQGGRPYDARGNHISEIVTELAVLSRFRRANQGQIFEGDTAQLVEQVQEYQVNLQRSLKGLGTRTGYATYFESWSPAEISEQDVVIESLKSLFVKQSIDTRIESALPLLAKIQQQGTAMKEANIFEAWAERLTEGTWQTPDTPEKQAELVKLLSTDLPVGADATNVTEQLYSLIGDDVLFDQLEQLAERDANADARQVILDRMQELSDDPDVRKVIEQLNIDATAEMNPAEPTNPADLEPMNESVLTDDTGSTLQHILNTFKRDVKDFEENDELSDDLYHALYDYYFDDMPYGTQKARTGDPHEWVADRFGADLGISGYGGRSPGVPDEDYSLERESVMHGDYAEEKSRIRKLAGMAPDATDEGAIGSILGGIGGAIMGKSPSSAMLGSKLGSAVQDSLTGTEETNEGQMKNIDIMRQDCKIMNDVQFIRAHGMTKSEFQNKYKDLLKDDSNPGVTPADLDGVSADPTDSTERAPLISGGQDNDLEFNEGSECNMTEAGENCSVHGMEECYGADTSPLAGQYGHSGKMKPVSKDLSFLDRLKELSGLRK